MGTGLLSTSNRCLVPHFRLLRLADRSWRLIAKVSVLLCSITLPGANAFAETPPTPSLTRFDTGPVRPVLIGGGPGAWDQFLREKVSVMQDGDGFRMWYVGSTDSNGSGVWKVGYATSVDGINWVKYPGNPVLNRESMDHDVCVVKASDGTLLMYVEVSDDHLDLFTSTNGIEWEPFRGNPIKQKATSPVVWREGTSWFMLYENMMSSVENIHLATSTNGRTWMDSPANPVLTESSTTVPDSVVKDGSTYHLYYHRFAGGGDYPAWHATSTDLKTWTDRTRLFTDSHLTTPSVLRLASGEVVSYVWNLNVDDSYYLRFGRQLGSETVWHFDEQTGIIAADASGNGADAVLLSGADWTAGPGGGGLTFDGIGEHAQAGYWANLDNWTVAAWVWSPAAPTSAPSSGPVQRGGSLQISWNHPTAAFRGAIAVSVGSSSYAASLGRLDANTWYHIVGTYDGETLRAYKNGELVTANTAPSGPARSESYALTFGRNAAVAQYFAGAIDEVRLYDRALTQQQIAALAQPDGSAPTTVMLTANAAGRAVSLSWTAAIDPDTGVGAYEIYRGTTAGGPKNLLAGVARTALSFYDTDATPFATYYYQVAAVNGVGLEGPPSNEASALIVPPEAKRRDGDFDGDGMADLAVFRPADGTWSLRYSGTGVTTGLTWGGLGDVPVQGDYDGDGKTDVAVYRPSSAHWFILKSSTNYTTQVTYQWGATGDRAVPGDFDGDAKTDIAIYRPATGMWYILKSTTDFTGGLGYAWGAAEDMPIAGDFDGDGTTDLTVYRPSSGHWFILKSSTNFTHQVTYQWGAPNDVSVAGDYDGDGMADIAVYRPSNGMWFILKSTTDFVDGDGYAWGADADVPIPGDYDGDGRTDIAVYRSSTAHWFILTSTTNYSSWSTFQLGDIGDIPVLQQR